VKPTKIHCFDLNYITLTRDHTRTGISFSKGYNFCMPILDAHSLEFFSRSPEQTRRVGMRMGRLIRPGDLICLHGDLGAGKTTLVQGLAQGWGALDPVSSPTFIIVNVYRQPGDQRLYHMDAYRLDSAPEAAELDLDEMLSRGPLLVEWPERIESVLPQKRMWVTLEYVAEEHRRMLLNAQGERYDSLLAELRQDLFGGA
jgi:tRNA threonylcarbamoyladenosine biosynthesis protein TsaE